VQPIIPLGSFLDEGRKLGCDEFRLQREAGFRRLFAAAAVAFRAGLFFSALFELQTADSPCSISSMLRPLFTLVS
jgi:hypothetical protein